MPTIVEQFSGARAGFLVVHAQMQLQRFGDLGADGQHRIQRGHRVLENHGDFRAAHQPHLFVRELQQVTPLEA